MITRRIAICGFGRVGRAFAELVDQKRAKLAADYGLELPITAVVDIGGAAMDPGGLAVPELLAHVADGGRVETFAAAGRAGMTGREVLSAGVADVLV